MGEHNSKYYYYKQKASQPEHNSKYYYYKQGAKSPEKSRRGLEPKSSNVWTPPRRATASRAAPWHCGEPKPNLLYCAPRGRRRIFREKHPKTPQICHFGAGSGCNSPLDACIPLYLNAALVSTRTGY